MHILYSFKPNVIIIWICTLAICINRVDLYLLGTQRFMCNVYCVVKQQSKMGNINGIQEYIDHVTTKLNILTIVLLFNLYSI